MSMPRHFSDKPPACFLRLRERPAKRVTSTDNLQASFGWPRPGEQQRNEAVLSQMVFMAEALWENKHAGSIPQGGADLAKDVSTSIFAAD